MVQTAISDPSLREGQIIDGWWTSHRVSKRVEGSDGMSFGRMVEHGTDPAKQVQEPAATPAADDDAIMTAAVLTSDNSAQSIWAAAFDGAIGRDRIAPCRCLTISFDGSADWDTPSGECRVDAYYYDADGGKVVDTIAKPNGSGAGVYTFGIPASMVEHVDVEACNGGGGTATMGVATIGATSPVALALEDYPGVSIYRPITEPASDARELAEYDEVGVLTSGVIGVKVEHEVSAGDPAYVRMVAAGTDLRGQFTGSDGADEPNVYAKLARARFESAASAGEIARLRIGA